MKRSRRSIESISSADSAEQPDLRLPHSSSAGSAARPARLVAARESKRSRGAESDKLLTTVAYIGFPLLYPSERRDAMDVIRQVMQTNADVINIAFAKDSDNNAMWKDINAEMQSSVGQPAYFCRYRGPLIIFVSEHCGKLVNEKDIDMEGGVPSICLSFDGLAGRTIIINVHWPTLASRTKARTLDNVSEETFRIYFKMDLN